MDRPGLAALAVLMLLAAPPAGAAPVAYDLQPDASNVTFETDFGGALITGDIPLEAADLVIDFDRLANCRIDVTLNAAKAGASFPFAADAMKGASVLDTRAHPKMRFTSTSVAARGDGASVKGNLTIRGVTRPVTLEARIWRQQGTETGDRSRLTIQLTGAVNRSDFGATGFADMVSDRVRITITARIIRRD
ncbi:MAG: YceI family protein [Rhodobacter sp.]|jgi:polyisoprenoid-binding protein YceI|nr:YceI family protein [Rhodobacter sp.]